MSRRSLISNLLKLLSKGRLGIIFSKVATITMKIIIIIAILDYATTFIRFLYPAVVYSTLGHCKSAGAGASINVHFLMCSYLFQKVLAYLILLNLSRASWVEEKLLNLMKHRPVVDFSCYPIYKIF
jgi:hypothetical protein